MEELVIVLIIIAVVIFIYIKFNANSNESTIALRANEQNMENQKIISDIKTANEEAVKKINKLKQNVVRSKINNIFYPDSKKADVNKCVLEQMNIRIFLRCFLISLLKLV